MKLNENEKRIFELLLEACPEGTTLRVAGGWVRDKLLEKESHDIDIAIDSMSGREFAELTLTKMKERDMTSHLTVIAARPEQSKHLETAQLKVYGQLIDFAHLRKETYADSRIPTVEPGTPEEDARRRDLTINALFYNLHTEKIEDYVNGTTHLAQSYAHTPIDPVQTFLDDPLRVLRVVRFSSKYGLMPHSSVIGAARLPEVRDAFLKKVSKERVWAEMIGGQEPEGWKDGFLTGPDPVCALDFIYRMGFREVLFRPEGELNPWDMDQGSSHHQLNVWDHTLASLANLVDRLDMPEDRVERAVRHLAVLFHDLGKLDPARKTLHEDGVHYQYQKHEISSAELADQLLTTLRAPHDIKSRVVKLCREHCRFFNLPPEVTDKTLRRILRDLGDDWENLLDICSADVLGKDDKVWTKRLEDQDPLPLEHFRVRLRALYEEMGQTKPPRPVNGNDLISEGVAKPGPEIGRLLKLLDEELLSDPSMTREAALEFVKRC
jgi:tRNA nucleotidyltransferase/poly(A) polymerase